MIAGRSADGGERPSLRLLVVMPSWVGDAVMATPMLQLLRAHLKGTFIGGLVRPGIDELLAGREYFDELHVERASGVMGPKFVAAKVRPRRYDTALLLANSFSSALVVRLAGIPRRIGYDRDARGLLLTQRMTAPRSAAGQWGIVPAVEYYMALAARFLMPAPTQTPPMRLMVTDAEAEKGLGLLFRAGVQPGAAYAVLNPGGNNAAKRWPVERFAALGQRLTERHGLRVLVNGSPAEAELTEEVARGCGGVSLAKLGITLGSLKAVVQGARLMVTNDTGPRHVAAALGVPLVSLFGPTDHRWTLIPTQAPEAVLTADPTLPPEQNANDSPERCAIERISIERVQAAVDGVLGGRGGIDPT